MATPNHLLYPVSLAAIRAGKHVLAEKPIGLNAQEAAALEEEAARAGVRYMAGYCLRFWLARHVRDLLAAGVAGEIRALTGVFAREPLNDGWSAFTETGGGPLLFLGSHLVDMILWFAGDIAVVAADRRGSSVKSSEGLSQDGGIVIPPGGCNRG